MRLNSSHDSDNESVASYSTTNSDSTASSNGESNSSDADTGYFARHGISAGPKENFASMFNRLAIKEGWSKAQRNKHRPEAIAGEIDGIYGADSSKLEKWQQLCRDVMIDPVPGSITKCKKACRR